MAILVAILVFCALILSHELGHFAAAKACGVYVEDFSLGMGPKLFHIKGKETTYTLRLLPIGGSCQMMGEDEDSENPRAFCNKKVWQRILIIAAGPIANFLFAIMIFVVVFMGFGSYSSENIIGTVIADSPAAEAGLQQGDRILSINGEDTSAWVDIATVINSGEAGEKLVLLVQRSETEQLALEIEPYYNEADAVWMIGIQRMHVKSGFFEAIGIGAQQSILFVKELFASIGGMIKGTVKVEVSGPVGIVNIISETTQYGIVSILLLTAFLSLNLGLINLFPLPALDGSRIVFLIVEGLRGKPFNREREGMVHLVGLFLLFGLMIVITYQDIVRLISG